MRKSRSFLGTRHNDGKFGPHIDLDDEKITSLIRLFDNENNQKRYHFPDLSPVINVVYNQIQAGFDKQLNAIHHMVKQEQEQAFVRELAVKYELLFDQWNYASSVEDDQKKLSQWDDVVKMSRELLIHLRDNMPDRVPLKDWNYDLADRLEQTGRMYTESLLFIIYARAAYEDSSLGRDPTLLKYCNQLKDKVRAQLTGDAEIKLILCARFHRPEDYYRVWQLCGRKNQSDADATLLKHIEEIRPERVDDPHAFYSSYSSNVQDAYCRKLETPRYTDSQWEVLYVLWNIYHRACQLEDFLEALRENSNEVDFSHTPESRESMEYLLNQLTIQS